MMTPSAGEWISPLDRSAFRALECRGRLCDGSICVLEIGSDLRGSPGRLWPPYPASRSRPSRRCSLSPLFFENQARSCARVPQSFLLLIVFFEPLEIIAGAALVGFGTRNFQLGGKLLPGERPRAFRGVQRKLRLLDCGLTFRIVNSSPTVDPCRPADLRRENKHRSRAFLNRRADGNDALPRLHASGEIRLGRDHWRRPDSHVNWFGFTRANRDGTGGCCQKDDSSDDDPAAGHVLHLCGCGQDAAGCLEFSERARAAAIFRPESRR